MLDGCKALSISATALGLRLPQPHTNMDKDLKEVLTFVGGILGIMVAVALVSWLFTYLFK